MWALTLILSLFLALMLFLVGLWPITLLIVAGLVAGGLLSGSGSEIPEDLQKAFYGDDGEYYDD